MTVLNIKGVNKSYKLDHKHVLSNLNFTLEKGEICAIIVKVVQEKVLY